LTLLVQAARTTHGQHCRAALHAPIVRPSLLLLAETGSYWGTSTTRRRSLSRATQRVDDRSAIQRTVPSQTRRCPPDGSCRYTLLIVAVHDAGSLPNAMTCCDVGLEPVTVMRCRSPPDGPVQRRRGQFHQCSIACSFPRPRRKRGVAVPSLMGDRRASVLLHGAFAPPPGTTDGHQGLAKPFSAPVASLCFTWRWRVIGNEPGGVPPPPFG